MPSYNRFGPAPPQGDNRAGNRIGGDLAHSEYSTPRLTFHSRDLDHEERAETIRTWWRLRSRGVDLPPEIGLIVIPCWWLR